MGNQLAESLEQLCGFDYVAVRVAGELIEPVKHPRKARCIADVG
jgi:hypothetical protein